MSDPLSHELFKERSKEILKASRRVVNLERRRARLTKALDECAAELRGAKRVLRDLVADQLPGMPADTMNIGGLS